MKSFAATILVSFFCACSGLVAQSVDTVDASPYFVIADDASLIWIYQVVGMEATFIDMFSATRLRIGNHDYAVRVRKYSTGGLDTAYYRAGNDGYYRTASGMRRGAESLVLPRKLYKGQKWYEVDSSWSYEVTSIHDSLTTPRAAFEDLVVITSRPVKTPDDKAQISRIYFAKGIGMIACTVQDKLQVYLKELRKAWRTDTNK